MTANAESLPKPKTSGPPPKRRFRNFLLNPKFQLKYTGMVVAVTVLVASFLGYITYDFSTDLTETVTSSQLAMEMHEDAQQLLIDESEAKDREILFSVIGGILILALALGFTGIIVTHKVVGPSYKMRRLINEVADGHLRLAGRLRKGDELQEVFEAFERMVLSLRKAQQEEVDLLDAAIQKARDAGTPEEALADVVEVRERMAEQLESRSSYG